MKPYSWRAAILKSDLPATTRHVLLTLSCYINEVGQSAYPSIETLARNTGLSDRAIIIHLQKARDKGYLTIGKHGFSGRRWAHNEYFPRLPSDEFEEVSPVDNFELRGERGSRLQNDVVNVKSSRGEPNDAQGVNHVRTNYPIELSNKTIMRSQSDTAVDKSVRATAKRLPENWVLPKTWGEWSLAQFPTWTADHVRQTAEMFRDHWIAASGQNSRKLDWFATWRNWCRKAPSPAQAKAGGSGSLPWYSSDALILEKGQSLGLVPLAGETMNSFKGRIQAKLDNPVPPVAEEKPAIVVRSDGPSKFGIDSVPEVASQEAIDLRKAAIEQARRLIGKGRPSDAS